MSTATAVRARQSLDRSECTVLAVCSCGWRELSFGDVEAWRLAVEHANACHDDSDRARNSMNAAIKRRNENGTTTRPT